MARDFKLPDLGEGLTEAEIVRVLVAEGDEIKEDQAVLLVETEKAQVELPSPFGGRVAAVHVQAGQRVKVGAVLLSIGDAGSAARAATPASAPPPRAVTPPPSAPAPAATPAPASAPPTPAAAAPATGLPPAATPATRRLARELGVELAHVRGTGPGGRISDEDVRAAAGASRRGAGAGHARRAARTHPRAPPGLRRRPGRPRPPGLWPGPSPCPRSRGSSSGDRSSGSRSAGSGGAAPSTSRSRGR